MAGQMNPEPAHSFVHPTCTQLRAPTCTQLRAPGSLSLLTLSFLLSDILLWRGGGGDSRLAIFADVVRELGYIEVPLLHCADSSVDGAIADLVTAGKGVRNFSQEGTAPIGGERL